MRWDILAEFVQLVTDVVTSITSINSITGHQCGYQHQLGSHAHDHAHIQLFIRMILVAGKVKITHIGNVNLACPDQGS